MAVLLVSLVAVLAAMLVLLACFRGFSRALKYKKVSGTFFRVEETAKRQKGGSRLHFGGAQGMLGTVRDGELADVSNGAVALVDLAIVLGSRRLPGDSRLASGRR